MHLTSWPQISSSRTSVRPSNRQRHDRARSPQVVIKTRYAETRYEDPDYHSGIASRITTLVTVTKKIVTPTSQRPKSWPGPASDSCCVWCQSLVRPARAPRATSLTEYIDTNVTDGCDDAERVTESTFGGGWVFFLRCPHYPLPSQSTGACTGASARRPFPQCSSPLVLHRIRVLDHRVFDGYRRVSFGREFHERSTSLMWRHAIQMGGDFITIGLQCLLRQIPWMKPMVLYQKLIMGIVAEDVPTTRNAPSSHQRSATAWRPHLQSLRQRS